MIDYIYFSNLNQMQVDLQKIDQMSFPYDEYIRIPSEWKPPENWDPSWKIRLRVKFDDNEDVIERMVSVHSEDGEILMYEFQSRSDPKALLEEYPPVVDPIVFQCQIALSEKLRGKSLALPFWVMSEIILIDTDPVKQRLIFDLSGNGWTKGRMPEYYRTLQGYFPKLEKIFEYDEDGVYFVIYDFDKK